MRAVLKQVLKVKLQLPKGKKKQNMNFKEIKVNV